MNPSLDSKRFRAYEIEFGAGGQRLGCKFILDDGALLFIGESEITPEIESLMASLGSPTAGLRDGILNRTNYVAAALNLRGWGGPFPHVFRNVGSRSERLPTDPD